MRKRILLLIVALAGFTASGAQAVAWQPPPCHDPMKCPIEQPPPDLHR